MELRYYILIAVLGAIIGAFISYHSLKGKAVTRMQWLRANELCFVIGMDRELFYCDNGWKIMIEGE